MPRRTSALTEAALALFGCLEELGARRTNPVLEVLRGADAVHAHRRYPEGYLRFGGAPLAAYYHCHDAPGRPAAEHGHFHVFVRPARATEALASWAHVAALSMDRMGQPLRWFAVNQWVTGSAWLPGARLAARLAHVPPAAAPRLALVERWLAAMLRLYTPELRTLLAQRDRALTGAKAARPADDILQDRALYVLATLPVDLPGKLGELLAAADAAGGLRYGGGVRRSRGTKP
jgi:hypothetical protein